MSAAAFYSLPASELVEGMDTDDGQRVINVCTVHQAGQPDMILYHVYTPSDDPEEDEDRQCAPEARMRPATLLVGLAVFPDTPVDGRREVRA